MRAVVTGGGVDGRIQFMMRYVACCSGSFCRLCVREILQLHGSAGGHQLSSRQSDNAGKFIAAQLRRFANSVAAAFMYNPSMRVADE